MHLMWRFAIQCQTNGEIAESESPALVLGWVAHSLILEGRAAFDEQYLVADVPRLSVARRFSRRATDSAPRGASAQRRLTAGRGP